MERIEDKPEGKLMAAIFGESDLNYYPYIVVEEDGKERRIELTTAIQEVLATLPPTDKKALELRFGLLDGRPRILREVGQELSGVTPQRARRIEAKAFQRLRHPSRSRCLKRFIALSPEEVNHLRKEINRLRDSNQSLNENNQRLRVILRGCSVTEKELEGVKPEDLASVAKSLKEDREALQILISRFPNNRLWNAVRREGIDQLSKIKELVRSGKIRKVRNVGKVRESFLKELLQTIEKEASP